MKYVVIGNKSQFWKLTTAAMHVLKGAEDADHAGVDIDEWQTAGG